MKPKSRAFYCYVGFVILYVLLTLATPPNKAVLHQYHISSYAARVMSTSVVLPLVLIWFAAFYGFAKLNQYARMIKKSKDGKSIAQVAHGITWLGLWLPLTGCLTALMNLWAERHPGFTDAGSIISGYVALAVALAGFMIISGGARRLTDNIKQRPSRHITMLMALSLCLIGVVYCYFVFTNRGGLHNIYHLPIWVLVFTVVVPYLFMWFTGLMAAVELRLYAKRSPGVVYRRSWRQLSIGLGWVIITSISLQYLTTLTNRLTRLRIGIVLAIVYLLLVMFALGYLEIALGAKKLQKIEEV